MKPPMQEEGDEVSEAPENCRLLVTTILPQPPYDPDILSPEFQHIAETTARQKELEAEEFAPETESSTMSDY